MPIADWSAFYILRKVYKSSDAPSIAVRERYFVATVLAIVTTINAILGANAIETRITGNPILPPGIPLIILSFSLILVSLPNMYWLWLYFTKRLK